MKFVGSPQFLTPFLFHVKAEDGIQNHFIRSFRSNALRLLPYECALLDLPFLPLAATSEGVRVAM